MKRTVSNVVLTELSFEQINYLVEKYSDVLPSFEDHYAEIYHEFTTAELDTLFDELEELTPYDPNETLADLGL